jgi:hypothetical protein
MAVTTPDTRIPPVLYRSVHSHFPHIPMSHLIKHSRDEYRQLISAANPGLILILVDQSSSMNGDYGKGTKASAAADAVNMVIYDIQKASQAGRRISDRCYLGVIGYGATVEGLMGGMISQVASTHKEIRRTRRTVSDGAGGVMEVDWSTPIWIYPRGENGTPMDEAFVLAHRAVSGWIREHPNCFPPVVINITDGVPNDMQNGGGGAKTRAAARSLLDLRTTDGGVLLFNAHISDTDQGELLMPGHLPIYADEYARFLMEISSTIPAPLLQKAQNAGFDAHPGARGLVFNARPETLVQLLTFGSTPMAKS